jgi:hypothetical protein
MTTIVTRASKGSALSWTDGDNNLINLNNDKIEAVVDDTTPQLGGNLDVNGNSIVSASNGNIAITPNGTGSIVLDGLNWPQADGTTDQVLKTNGSGQLSWTTVSGGGASAIDDLTDVTITSATNGQVLTYSSGSWINMAASSGISQLQDDPSPTLGANLRVNGYSIVSLSNGNITIAPNGTGSINLTPDTGSVYIDGAAWPSSLPTTGQVLTAFDGSGNLTWMTPTVGATTLTELADVGVTTPSNGQTLVYNSTASKWQNVTVSSGITQLQDDTTPTLGGNLRVNGNSIVSVSNGNIPITPDGTGKIILDGLSWPTSDGSANQVLKTDGAGNLSWATASGGPSMAFITRTGYATVSGTTRRASFSETLDPSGIISLTDSNYRFTLAAGTYIFKSVVYQYQIAENYPTSSHIIYNITDSSATVSDFCSTYRLNTSNNTFMLMPADISFTIAGTKTFEYRWTVGATSYADNALPTFIIFKIA